MGNTANIAVYIIGALLMLSVIHTASGIEAEDLYSVMRAAKCVIPNGLDHATRAAFLQQCLSENYAQGNETVCYDELGCFPMDSPWTSLFRPFPSPLHPAEINVRLYCYTKESPERYNITLWPKINLEACNFIPSRKTAFIVHGFASNGNSTWVSNLKDTYLNVSDVNLFLVDWGSGAELLNYLQVASNTRIVGAEVGRFLKWMVESKGLDPGDVHLMGHSLGAHICSYMARAVPGIARLTAFDPAQPGFEAVDKECRLDEDDADFVEVLHTNAAPFIPLLGFGLMAPCGHIDIYFNGGLRQPGCQFPKFGQIKGIKDLITFPIEFINMLVSCSHGRSYLYFTSALAHKDCFIWCRHAGIATHLLNGLTMGYLDPLISKLQKCDAKSCFPLGLDTPNYKARGVFTATTDKDPPYCETDPEINSKMFREIAESIAEDTAMESNAASGEADAVREAAGTGQDVVAGAADKGKEDLSGLRDYN